MKESLSHWNVNKDAQLFTFFWFLVFQLKARQGLQKVFFFCLHPREIKKVFFSKISKYPAYELKDDFFF